MNRTFHVHVHASSTNATLETHIHRLGEVELPVLHGFVPKEQFASTFEETAARLEALPGLFFEPDGSFAWNRQQRVGVPPASPVGVPPALPAEVPLALPVKSAAEHLEGMLYDRYDRVQYCEVKGDCSRDTIENFLTQVKGDEASTVIQLAREGLFLQEQMFLDLWES